MLCRNRMAGRRTALAIEVKPWPQAHTPDTSVCKIPDVDSQKRQTNQQT